MEAPTLFVAHVSQSGRNLTRGHKATGSPGVDANVWARAHHMTCGDNKELFEGENAGCLDKLLPNMDCRPGMFVCQDPYLTLSNFRVCARSKLNTDLCRRTEHVGSFTKIRSKGELNSPLRRTLRGATMGRWLAAMIRVT